MNLRVQSSLIIAAATVFAVATAAYFYARTGSSCESKEESEGKPKEEPEEKLEEKLEGESKK